jgi:hypothetical protein
MPTQANTVDAVHLGRRQVGYIATPVTMVDIDGREIASFRLPRKLSKAIVAAELILVAGEKIHVGQILGVVS